jgi:predicted NBD/HSP70 family sugar kinase
MSTTRSVLGIDTGGTTTRMWCGKGDIRRFDTPRDYDKYLNMVGQAVREANANTVVIGVPAIVERHQKVVTAVNLGQEWSGKDLAADLRALTGASEVVILQDTEAAGYTLQEQLHVEESHAMLITLSTGIGGAWVCKQFVEPLQLGHMPFDFSGKGHVCTCGQTGCVEAELGGWAINKVHGPAENIDDPEFWKDYGTKAGRFFLALTTQFRLQKIGLMGGISQKWGAFEDHCIEYMQTHLKHVPMPQICIMHDGDSVGVKGAYYFGGTGTTAVSQKYTGTSIRMPGSLVEVL